MDQKLFPSVLRVLIEAKDQKANRSAIVQSIQDKLLAEGGTKINNLNEEIKKILQQGVDFGLFNEKNDWFRLIFRPYTVPASVENDQATTSKQMKRNDDDNGQPPNMNLPSWASDSDELSANEDFSKFAREIGSLRKSDLFHIFKALKKPDLVDFCTYNRGRKRSPKRKKNFPSKIGSRSRSKSRGRKRRG